VLWLRSWRETRTRFWLCGVALGGNCAGLVFYYNLFCRKRGLLGGARLNYYPEYIRGEIFGSSAVQSFFVLLVVLLGTGGLLHERAIRTAGFTLALPVPRWRLFVPQIGVGLLQTAVLALIPVLVIVALSPSVGLAYPLAHATSFALAWSVCGSAGFALAFLSSAIFEGEYVAPVVSVIVIAAVSYVSDIEALKGMSLDIQAIMSNSGRIAVSPWGKLSVIAAAALLMFWIATGCLYRRDF